MKLTPLFVLIGLCDSIAFGQTTRPVNLYGDDKIRLVVRADDFGFSHASNMALQRLLNEGTITAASVIVNTGWLDATVEILKKHPEVSVGVHVCLNSEWVPYKWGPVLPAKEVPSLVDEWGHFFGTRKDLLAHRPDADEVEREIRAQVDLAIRKPIKGANKGDNPIKGPDKGDRPDKGDTTLYLTCPIGYAAAMPRIARIAPGGLVYHVLNRANDRRRIFRTPGDFRAFYDVLLAAMQRHPTRLLGWCVMGNHWHFVPWPREDGELSRFFGYLSLTHAARWQTAHRAVGSGHVYQARFKNFIIQQAEDPLIRVLKYAERNPLRAGLVRRAEDWPYSSLHARLHGPDEIRALLSDWPVEMPRDWRAWARQVNQAQVEADEQSVASAIRRGSPLGNEAWMKRTVNRFDLQSTIRPRGRPVGWRKAKQAR